MRGSYKVSIKAKCPRCGEVNEFATCPNCHKKTINFKKYGWGYPGGCAECDNCGFYTAKGACPDCNANISFEKCKIDEDCFITTAVCNSLKKSDDCYELSILRRFRDTWLSTQEKGDELIREYYNIAPAIVEVIDRLNDKKDIYIMIYERYIQPCIALIENKKERECMNLYKEMVHTLKQIYLVTA